MCVFIAEKLKALKPHDSMPPIDTIKKVDNVVIDSLEVGVTFQLENINFYAGRHVLLQSSIKSLELLLSTLKSHPNLEIEIQGYICCINEDGDGYDLDTQTKNLSVNRAKEVYDYLIKNEINPQRLSYKGFGSKNKLVKEVTESDRITNRRVEIKVLKN